MCLVESDPPERASGAAPGGVPEARNRAAAEDTVPGLDELFSDPAVRRRVGEVISRAARPLPKP